MSKKLGVILAIIFVILGTVLTVVLLQRQQDQRSRATSSYPKGTSYTPTDKWRCSTASTTCVYGINWEGYETDMRDMQNADINWVRVGPYILVLP